MLGSLTFSSLELTCDIFSRSSNPPTEAEPVSEDEPLASPTKPLKMKKLFDLSMPGTNAPPPKPVNDYTVPFVGDKSVWIEPPTLQLHDNPMEFPDPGNNRYVVYVL